MTSAREQILAGVRRSLGRGELDANSQAELHARLKNPAANLIPERGKGSREEQVDRFVEMSLEAASTVDKVPSLEDVPAAIAAYLARENLPARLVQSPELDGEGLSWDKTPTLEIRSGVPDIEDEVGLVMAQSGVAETGTIYLKSGADKPTTLNFLPDTHIIILKRSEIVGSYEDAWTKFRADVSVDGDVVMPRTVNLVTGPSRTGDIELKMQMGAHGPRRVHIVLIED